MTPRHAISYHSVSWVALNRVFRPMNVVSARPSVTSLEIYRLRDLSSFFTLTCVYSVFSQNCVLQHYSTSFCYDSGTTFITRCFQAFTYPTLALELLDPCDADFMTQGQQYVSIFSAETSEDIRPFWFRRQCTYNRMISVVIMRTFLLIFWSVQVSPVSDHGFSDLSPALHLLYWYVTTCLSKTKLMFKLF